jgi:hypothetical protein
MTTAHTSAMKIEELAYNLENITRDDSKRTGKTITPNDLPVEDLVKEARYVLSLFIDPDEAHINREAYLGEEGPDQKKWARQQVKQLRAFVKKFGTGA